MYFMWALWLGYIMSIVIVLNETTRNINTITIRFHLRVHISMSFKSPVYIKRRFIKLYPQFYFRLGGIQIIPYQQMVLWQYNSKPLWMALLLHVWNHLLCKLLCSVTLSLSGLDLMRSCMSELMKMRQAHVR